MNFWQQQRDERQLRTHEEIVDKRIADWMIEDSIEGSRRLALRFDDDTYIVWKASQNYVGGVDIEVDENPVDDLVAYGIGLITEGEYKRQRDARREQERQLAERDERAILARLKEKYERS